MKKLLLFMAMTGSGYAQRMLPEELAIARSITMQEEGEVLIAPGVEFFKLADEKLLVVGSDFEYGLSDRVELDAEVPYVFRNPNHGRSVSGIGDIEVAARYSFVPMTENSPFAFNAGLSVTTPTGSRDKELGEGQVALGPFFTASEWLGPVNVQLNCAWAHVVTNGGEEPRDEFEYNVSVVYPVRGWFFVLEGNGESNHRQTKYYLTPEVVWRPKHSFQIQLAAPIGLTRAAGDYGLIASVSFEFDGPFAHGRDND